MKTLTKRTLALSLCLLLCFALLPASAQAAEAPIEVNVPDTILSYGYQVLDLRTGESLSYSYSVPENGVTVLFFYSTTCGNCSYMLNEYAASDWFDDENISFVLVESNSSEREETQSYIDSRLGDAQQYATLYYGNRSLQWSYYHIAYDSSTLTWPVMVYITSGGSENTVRYISSGYQDTATVKDTIDLCLPEGAEEPEEPEEPAEPTEEEVLAAMLAMKEEYPEGMHWTNDDSYVWKGSPSNMTYIGYGCVAFAYLLNDAAFGDEPNGRRVDGVDYGSLRTGDIVRINNNSHSVILLEVHDDYVIVAEGNYNSSIHWGRQISRANIEAGNYVMTRWAEQSDHVHEWGDPDWMWAEDCSWAEATFTCLLDSSHTKTVSATVTTEDRGGYILYTATVVFEGETYESSCLIPKSVENYGDLSGDAAVDGRDAILLRQYLAGWAVTVDLRAADVNNDGGVDGSDAVLLEQYLVGWSVTLG